MNETGASTELAGLYAKATEVKPVKKGGKTARDMANTDEQKN